MIAWWYVAGGGAWILLHFVTYAAGLRALAALRSESGIFIFHAGSFGLLLAGAVLAAVRAPGLGMLAAGILVLSVHGIYSLSFLELWSLSQGSYSLRLLHFTAEGARPAAGPVPSASELGASKIQLRLESLRQLNLVRQSPGGERLTAKGVAIAGTLGAFLRLTNGRSLNR